MKINKFVIILCVLFIISITNCSNPNKKSTLDKTTNISSSNISSSLVPLNEDIVEEKEKAYPIPKENKNGKIPLSITASPLENIERISNIGLKAGSHNDNDEFVRYLNYLNRPFIQKLNAPKLNIRERYIIQIKDKKGNPIPNCKLVIKFQDQQLSFLTYSSGEIVFFPKIFIDNLENIKIFNVNGYYNEKSFSFSFPRKKNGNIVSFTTSFERKIPHPIPLDIVFLLDTTGSMGDEIQQLKDTLYSIHYYITNRLRIKPHVRFAMVLYRDIGDQYLNKLYPFTDDLEKFQRDLDNVRSDGGGDNPEELDKALYRTIEELNWNKDGLKLVFLFTDAPPHIERPHKYNYIWSSKKASQKGIKIYPVGASGLNILGEYVLRQIALLTLSQYIFLTYGEKGESSESSLAKVSHHTGANYNVMRLDRLITRIIKKELSYLTDKDIIRDEEIPAPMSFNADLLDKKIYNLVSQLIYQLESYNNKLNKKITIALFPLEIKKEERKRLKNISNFIQEGIEKYLKENSNFKLLEREDIKKAFIERLNKSNNILEDKELSELTKINGANTFLSGKIYLIGESVVIFAKIVDVETLEKLAVARVLWTEE